MSISVTEKDVLALAASRESSDVLSAYITSIDDSNETDAFSPSAIALHILIKRVFDRLGVSNGLLDEDNKNYLKREITNFYHSCDLEFKELSKKLGEIIGCRII